MSLNDYLQDKDSLAAQPRNYEQAITRDIKFERTPFTQPTQISKGTVQTNLGGVLQLKDSTGGTNILTYDPDTGTVTILGALVAQQVNTGTYTNISMGGTTIFSGTMTVGGILSGGTLNNSIIGTPAITGGTMTSGVVNGATVGTPTITGGALNAAAIGTPNIINGTITTPRMIGTPVLDVNASTAALGVNGNFALQTLSGSVVLVARSGGTTFYFASSGTF